MILNRTPVRVGTPHQKVCHTKQEALDRINRHNGHTDVYVTLYNGVIDKVVWDFDIEPGDEDKYDDWEGMIEDYRSLKERIEDEGYSYMCVFSGGGMHFYLKTRESKLEYPRYAIKTVQQKYQKELQLKSDTQVFGDVERIFRVPNTWHPGHERYCIPLLPEEIYLPKDEIVELAQEQRFDIEPIQPGDDYPIHKHDKAGTRFSFEGDKVVGNFNPAEVEPENTVMPIYPCISNLLQNWEDMEKKGHGLGFRRRFLIILHLKETGHTYEETVSVLKKYLSRNEFKHCVYDEKQVQQIYKRDDLLFPACKQLATEIPCIHKPENDQPCESRDSLYL